MLRNMRNRQSRVLYSARRLGGWSGGGLSPLDWLEGFAALDESIKVTVMTETPRETISTPIANSERIDWLLVGSGRWKSPPRWREFIGRLFDRLAVRRIDPAVVIAEGRHGFRLTRRLGARGTHANAVVVRGQPDQYAEDIADMDRLSVLCDAIGAADAVIFNAPSVQRDWESRGVLDGKRCFSISNTSREDLVNDLRERERDDVRSELGLSPDALVILCLGSVLYRKGQDLLLDAWPEIKSALPNAELHLVGPISRRGDGESIAARAAGMKDVITTGPRMDALDYVYAADILVLPSRGESMPRAILEAMALGTPVVASTAGAIPDLIEDRTGGRLFAVDDLAAMTDCIVELGRSAALRHQLADNARNHYWKAFSREHQREQLRRTIATLLAGQ